MVKEDIPIVDNFQLTKSIFKVPLLLMGHQMSNYLLSSGVILGVTNPGALLHSVLVDRLKDPAMHSTLAFQDHGWPLIPPPLQGKIVIYPLDPGVIIVNLRYSTYFQ